MSTLHLPKLWTRWERAKDYRGGRSAVNAKLMITAAGPIGESLYVGSNKQLGADRDVKMIAKLRRRFAVTDTRMKRLERQTQRVLEANLTDVMRLATT